MLGYVSFLSYFCTPYYDNQYNPMLTISSTSVKDIILYPNKFNMSPNNSIKLWNTGNANESFKTIYNPAPEKFTLPMANAFSGFSLSNVLGGFNKGWNFYCNPNTKKSTIFFSALGLRDSYLDFIDQGHYWSIGNDTTAYGMGFDTSSLYLMYAYSQLYGFPLRIVSDD